MSQSTASEDQIGSSRVKIKPSRLHSAAGLDGNSFWAGAGLNISDWLTSDHRVLVAIGTSYDSHVLLLFASCFHNDRSKNPLVPTACDIKLHKKMPPVVSFSQFKKKKKIPYDQVNSDPLKVPGFFFHTALLLVLMIFTQWTIQPASLDLWALGRCLVVIGARFNCFLFFLLFSTLWWMKNLFI